MDWLLLILVYGVVMASLLIGGVWIGTVMGFVGLFGMTLASGTVQWSTIGDILWNTTNSFELVAVPLFVLMGDIVLRSGLTQSFYGGISHWLRPLPGGLLHSNIAGCAAFSAISGSSTATALTVGTVALPELRRRNYNERLSLGSLAAGGCLGILIPPSIPLIIYASVVQESIISLFMAGILPGLMIAGLFMAYIFVRAVIDPSIAPTEGRSAGLATMLRDTLGCLPLIILMVFTILSMYAGFATPTEAAACGCLGALILGRLLGTLTVSDLRDALVTAVATSCVVMFITINAQLLTFAIVTSGIAQGISSGIVNSGLEVWSFLLITAVIYLIMGCFIDGLSMMFLTVPVLFPSIIVLGIDPVWFGIFMVILIEVGQITPPVGLNLFAIQSISGGKPMAEVGWGSLPFVFVLLLSCIIIYVFPEIALYLPSTVSSR